MPLGPIGLCIQSKLQLAFAPSRLEVIDESFRHQGHAGARPEGETHFRVKVQAEAFRGQSRLAQHRLINAALSDLMGKPVHALAIESAVPD